MDFPNNAAPICPQHGKPTKRGTCRSCNTAYMGHYQKQRRHTMPGRAMWERARKRACERNLEFSLHEDSVFVPRRCPVLGLAITPGSTRAASSPSVDRIHPMRGYVPDNVRAISDRANRLKGDRSINELRHFADHGPLEFRADYRMIVTYLEREMLLSEVREKAKQKGRAGKEWAKIAFFLDRVFRNALINDGGPQA